MVVAARTELVSGGDGSNFREWTVCSLVFGMFQSPVGVKFAESPDWLASIATNPLDIASQGANRCRECRSRSAKTGLLSWPHGRRICDFVLRDSVFLPPAAPASDGRDDLPQRIRRCSSTTRRALPRIVVVHPRMVRCYTMAKGRHALWRGEGLLAPPCEYPFGKLRLVACSHSSRQGWPVDIAQALALWCQGSAQICRRPPPPELTMAKKKGGTRLGPPHVTGRKKAGARKSVARKKSARKSAGKTSVRKSAAKKSARKSSRK